MKKSSRMSIVHPHAAGVDIGAEFHVVAVPPDADADPVRTFQSFTGDLHRMSDWFKTCHITTIAMESTGVYWLPAFEILEAAGFNVILVNARDAKNVPGRKTDVNDAQWLQKLHSFGLLRASFRPEHDISVLRSYLRQRERLTEYRAAHIQHMQKALMQMNVQLHHAVSDITGVTGLSIVRAIVSGERDPGLAPIFPYTFYHLTHYWFDAADIPVANDTPVHYADAFRCNVRRPPRGSLPLLTRLVSA
ncbi:hypothetical protein EATA6166_45350 (plasmid) [Enterobacter asburiae]|nr:hypothetical protein EAS17NKHM_p11210 [Enterobacter asburiae]BEK76643.1 hypothetical protein EATA6166_45350 [Enterobacter asburiae]